MRTKSVRELIDDCRLLIRKNKQWINKNVNDRDREVLNHLKPFLQRGKTGKHRKKMKNYYKAVLFYFITLSYEIGAPEIDDKTVKLYQNIFKEVLNACFSENGRFGVSFHAREHRFIKAPNQKTLNFHITVPRFLADKEQIDRFYPEFNELDEDVKVWNSLFFFIMLSNEEVTERFRKHWHEYVSAHSDICKHDIFKYEPDIMTTGKDYQNLDDIRNVENYKNNEALRVFKDVIDLWQKPDSDIAIQTEDGISSQKLGDFLERYLIKPNHRFVSTLRWSGHGCFCGNARFSKIMEYATFLRFGKKALYELSPQAMIACANEYTEFYKDDSEIGYRSKRHIRSLKNARPGFAITHPKHD